MKQFIQEFELHELQEQLDPSFRAKQIFDWLYHKQCSSFEQMKNLPKSLIEELKGRYEISVLSVVTREKSVDGSIKYLFKLRDGHTIEAVLLLMKPKVYNEDGTIKHQERYTICISSQVGCKVGCTFCLTAKDGFIRDLSTAEITEQVRMIKSENSIDVNRRVNIVFMGMGEPLDNLDEVAKAIKIFAHEDAFMISAQRQTVSTSGLSHKIQKLAKMDLGVNLAISLHAVDDKLREKLMPINRAYNIASIIEAVKGFPVKSRKRVLFEYLVIKDVNDNLESAKRLIRLLEGIKAKINLIYFNPYPGTQFQRPSLQRMKRFQEYLLKKGMICTIRESKGIDISAACGQLREQKGV